MITFTTGMFPGSRFQNQDSVAFQSVMPFWVFASAISPRSIMTEGTWVVRGTPGQRLVQANNGLLVPVSKVARDPRGVRLDGMDVPRKGYGRIIS